MNQSPAPRRPLAHPIPVFPTVRIYLFIPLALLLATTALACSSPPPTPTPHLESTLQARIAATRQVETSVEATVEAIKPIAEAVQATLTARTNAEPTPTTAPSDSHNSTPQPQFTTAYQDCDQLLRERLVSERTATDAYTMQSAVRQIQTANQECSVHLWNPRLVDPIPHQSGTCLATVNGLDPSRLPPGLLTPDVNAPRPTSGRDQSNNVIAYWSHRFDEKPSDLSNCWIYISDTNSWMTGRDLQAETTTFAHIDLKQGDCLLFAEGRVDNTLDPAKVPCEGAWTHRVVSSFELTDPGHYPNIAYVQYHALLNCNPNHTIYLYPLEPSWQFGDRRVTCLQNSFGLSLSDPAKLDNMVNSFSLSPKDCFNAVPESSYIQVEHVACSGHWEFRVLHTFEAADSRTYPTANRLNQQSILNCDRRTTQPLHPAQKLWDARFRTTLCLQENPTGLPGTPEILDRLVNPYLLDEDECFNEYANPELLLAELTHCSGDWQYQVLATHAFPNSSAYPGDAAMAQQTANLCAPADFTHTPDDNLWQLGYRRIICLSDGTAAADSTTPPSDPTLTAQEALEEGIALEQAGQHHEALAALQRAQRLFGGTSATTESWMGFVYESLGNLPTAIDHHTNAIALDDTALARVLRADAFLESNNCASAEADAHVVLRKPPETSPAFHSHVEAQWLLALCASDDQAALSHAQDAHRGAQSHGYSQADLEEMAALIDELNEAVLTSFRIGPQTSQRLTTLTDLPNARWLSQSHPQVADKLASLPWTADGLSPAEESLIEQLLYLYVENTTAPATSLLHMPFLQSVTPGDLEAVSSLKAIAHDDDTSFQRILSHPTFSGHGITDAWTPIVATLESANRYDKALIPMLLDPALAHMESRTIQTPLRGQVALNIIRTTSNYNTESINHLEHAVRNAEAFMHEPFPTDMVALLYADAVKRTYAGHNAGTGMVILPEYDVPDHEYSQKITDHEVAHYYWSGNEQWVDEGMAEFMASTFLAHRQGTRTLPDNRPCHQYRTISQIPKTEATHRCSYSLGERLFIDLHDTVGTQQFRATMTAFYRDSPSPSFTIGQDNTEKGITHIRSHFTAPAAQQVIDRWYDGSSPYRTDLYDEDPVDPRLSVLNASISEATLSINDRPVSSFSARSTSHPVKLSIKYQHPTPVGKAGHIPITVIIFYQDGHPYYTKNSELEAQAGTIGAGIWYPLWQPGDPPMATGDHVAYVYEAGNKVAQIHWTVTP